MERGCSVGIKWKRNAQKCKEGIFINCNNMERNANMKRETLGSCNNIERKCYGKEMFTCCKNWKGDANTEEKHLRDVII